MKGEEDCIQGKPLVKQLGGGDWDVWLVQLMVYFKLAKETDEKGQRLLFLSVVGANILDQLILHFADWGLEDVPLPSLLRVLHDLYSKK